MEGKTREREKVEGTRTCLQSTLIEVYKRNTLAGECETWSKRAAPYRAWHGRAGYSVLSSIAPLVLEHPIQSRDAAWRDVTSTPAPLEAVVSPALRIKSRKLFQHPAMLPGPLSRTPDPLSLSEVPVALQVGARHG